MSLPFLATLVIALVTGFLSLNTEDALSAFFAIAGGISLVIGFVVAAWWLKLLILGLALAGFRYYCWSHSCNNADPLR